LEALVLLTRFFLAKAPESLRSETVDLLLHQMAEFVSDLRDIAGVHEAVAFMASASDDAATGGYEGATEIALPSLLYKAR
jgi:hypothetical protein